MKREVEAAQRRDIAIERLASEAAKFTSRGRYADIAERLNAEGVQTFQGGRPWTPDNVKKALGRLNLNLVNGDLQSPALKSQANIGLLDGFERRTPLSDPHSSLAKVQASLELGDVERHCGSKNGFCPLS